MIDYKELRIDNLILEAGKPKKVFQISRATINYNHQMAFRALQLTPEWLARFGFVERFGDWRTEGITITKEFDEFFLVADYNEYNRPIISGDSIRYVHTLQNIAFSLFNIELTLKDAS